MIDEQFSRAVIAYVGRVGQHDDQGVADDRVAAAIGEPAPDVVANIRAMLNVLNSVQPPLWDFSDIGEVGRRATSWLRARHPELSDAAIAALSNQFSFDWK